MCHVKDCFKYEKNPCLHSQLLVHIVVIGHFVFGVYGHSDVWLRLFPIFLFKYTKI